MLLIKFDFSKANVIAKEAGNHDLVTAYLFSIFWKELISFIQVLQSWIMRHLPIRCQRKIVQQQGALFIHVKNIMNLAACIGKLVGNTIVTFVIELLFVNDITPLQRSCF